MFGDNSNVSLSQICHQGDGRGDVLVPVGVRVPVCQPHSPAVRGVTD